MAQWNPIKLTMFDSPTRRMLWIAADNSSTLHDQGCS